MEQGTREVIEHIDENELIGLLEELIRIPSPTGEEEGISQFISSWAERMGFTSVHQSDKGDVVAEVEGRGKGPKLLLLTHTDHSKPIDSEAAYRPKVVDGQRFGKGGRVVTGKGSCAPKATLAALLYAGKMLAQQKEQLRGSVIIAAVSRDLLANHDGVREVAEKGWIDADMAVVGEPSGNQPVLGARGINHIAITLHGIPTHWGRPEGGVNPIWAMEPVLGVVKGLIEGLPSHASLGKATLAPIDIQCEMSPPQTPRSCRLVLDRRTLPGEDAREVVEGIQDKLGGLSLEKLKVNVETIRQMYPFEGNPESPISKKVMETHEAITGNRLPYGYLTFSSNGGFLTGMMKMPSVVYGPGRIEDMMPSEHVEVESVLMAAKVYGATAFEMLHRDS